MIATKKDLTDLVGSRICHDLISPLGAIGNGVELLTMSGAATGPEVSLIAQSIENANARIRFFRIAFGAASDEQSLSERDIKSVLQDMYHGGQFNIDWQATGDLARKQVKLAFLLLQCFETAMPWGGQVTLSAVGGEWAVHGSAERLKIDPDLWAVLSNPSETTAIDPAQVHFALAPLAANALGRRLTVQTSQTEMRVRF